MANFKLRQTGEQIQNDLDKIENDALVKPGIAPSATSILAIDSTNTQTMLTVGHGLNVKNGALNVTEGTSVTVSDVSESTEDGGNNVVTFSDGKTLTVKNGKTGATGEKGDKGDQGIQGEKGEDGVSPTVATEAITGGTKVTITDKDGVHEFNVMDGKKGDKGEKGDKGDTGPQGLQGIQGPKGDTGETGQAGYTPVKGTDYFTDEDKAELVTAVVAALPKYAGEVV